MRAEIKSKLTEKYRSRITSYIKNHLQDLSYLDTVKIARQFIPSELELKEDPQFTEDPLQEEDEDIHPLPFLIHKYVNKLLILTTENCPVYCRYCTRKRKTLSRKNSSGGINLAQLKKYIQANPKINEIILSGGDPLMLSNARLEALVKSCLEEKTISFIRYHTRMATADPGRFSDSLYSTFKVLSKRSSGKIHTIVFHINHPKELTKESYEIFQRLRSMGYHLFSQSVLLRRVNDRADILFELFKKLFEVEVRPYYLHQLDKIEGSSHFHVPIEKGIRLMKEVKDKIPPYMMPSYVKDSKYGKSKIIY